MNPGFVFALVLTAFFSFASGQDLPTSLDQLPPSHELPDLFTFDDGSKVTTVADWERRRKELIVPLMFYQYGRIPPRPDRVVARVDRIREHESGLGTEQWLTLIIDSKKKLKMRALAYVPKTKGPHPVIIKEEGKLGGSKNAAMFLKSNYLFIEYARGDLAPDKRGSIGPAQKAYPEFDWAMLAVWAWGGMRVVDYLETRGDIDLKHIAITGHSRGGKAALLAGALDERITLVAPNGSGAGGGGSSRVLGPGAESIGMNDKPNWYHKRILLFAEKEAHLPFDQHFVKALVAPRGLLCIESTDDHFANPVGTLATSHAAMPAFKLYRQETRNGLCYRRGGHTFSTEDWKTLLNFAELTFFDRAPANGQSFWQEPTPVLPRPNRKIDPGFVSVGDPGNKNDKERPRVGAFGAVDYPFEIARHKVSNAEYAEFLNATAQRADPHGLHHPKMRITRIGPKDAYRFVATSETAGCPVTYVGWHDAVRYCNWLHGGDTERGAYQFSNPSTVGPRTRGAKYFLPSEDEWYKAVYYDPKKKNYARFLRSLFAITKNSTEDLGSPRFHQSPSGIDDYRDHIWEWTESQVGDLFRGVRTDSWFQGNNRQAAGRFYSNPELELGHLGFRVARAPAKK